MHRDKIVEMMAKTCPPAAAGYQLKPSIKGILYAIK